MNAGSLRLQPLRLPIACARARAASWPGRGEGDVAGTLELCRGENCPPLIAYVIPLAASRAAAVFDIDRPAAAVFVVDPAAGLGAQIQRLAARFGLTIAETGVLAEIIGGTGLLAAATKLKITEATARTHASRILAKTGTARQTELIRRFFETALPGISGSDDDTAGNACNPSIASRANGMKMQRCHRLTDGGGG